MLVARAAAALLLVFNAGCGARTSLDDSGAGGSAQPPPSGGQHASDCVALCADAEPIGAEVFIATGSDCICQDCSESCATAVCEQAALPSEECLPCVKTSIFGDECENHAGLFGVCFEPSFECGAFTQCLLACDP